MGVRIVMRKDGVTYIGADVFPNIRAVQINEYNSYIKIIHPELIVAKSKNSKVLDLLDIFSEWFQLDDGEHFTKEKVIHQIANPLYLEAKHRKLIDSDTQLMDANVFIICKHSFFQILENFAVIEIHDFASNSYEEMIVYPYMYGNQNIDHPKEMIKTVMKAIYKHISYVQETFIVFNTKDLAFEIHGGKSS